ncbi:MAG: hypothetical protein LUH07_06185, partial [Lachnospiraceae bacterium]|nr:hypothetical protein [Lachnospiraceae bacterium]
REHKEIAYTELIRNLMSCRVSKKHPLAQKSILRIEDLRGYRILLPPQGLTTVSDQMRDYIKAEEPEIDLVEMKNSGYMQGTSTQKNIIQILSSWRRTFVEENCVNIPLEWGDRLGEGLFYQNPASNQVMKFVDIAREAFREGLFEEWVGKQ